MNHMWMKWLIVCLGKIVLFGHNHLVGNMVFTPWICAYRIFRQTHITSHDEFSLYKIILNHMPSEKFNIAIEHGPLSSLIYPMFTQKIRYSPHSNHPFSHGFSHHFLTMAVHPSPWPPARVWLPTPAANSARAPRPLWARPWAPPNAGWPQGTANLNMEILWRL